MKFVEMLLIAQVTPHSKHSAVGIDTIAKVSKRRILWSVCVCLCWVGGLIVWKFIGEVTQMLTQV